MFGSPLLIRVRLFLDVLASKVQRLLQLGVIESSHVKVYQATYIFRTCGRAWIAKSATKIMAQNPAVLISRISIDIHGPDQSIVHLHMSTNIDVSVDHLVFGWLVVKSSLCCAV
jgi:hypothetical protein